MAEWTSDAKEYLEGYLRQVAALARSQGDDGDDIAAGLREHITNEVEADASSLVTVEQLRKTLASVGTPEQVVSPDFTLVSRERKESGGQQRPPTPSPRRENPIIINAPPAKTRSGCWLGLATVVVLLIAGPVILAILGIVAGITLPALSRSREAARRASCQGNLKQAAMVCQRYADDHDGYLPSLSAKPGEFSMEPSEVSGKYVTDDAFLACPSDETPPLITNRIPGGISDDSYLYLGYVVTNGEEGRAFIDAYRRHLAAGGTFDQDISVESGSGTGGSGRFLRLQTDPNSVLAKETYLPAGGIPAPAEIPVMFDRSDNHIPGGINVLYLDGHVEFIKMGDRFPAQQWFLDELARIGENR
jgi:prepilin-type processing-associated H-X9-DG protein